MGIVKGPIHPTEALRILDGNMSIVEDGIRYMLVSEEERDQLAALVRAWADLEPAPPRCDLPSTRSRKPRRRK